MKKKVFAYIHTHWDREWYREFEEFRLRLVEVFDDVINKLLSNELETFYFDGQTLALEDYLEIKPQSESVVRKLIADKKLFIGPYFCSTDSFLVDAESLIKNLQLGIKYSNDFGCNDFIAYHADTFGHSCYIPQIVKYFDIKNAVFWRGLGELESEILFRGLKSTYLIEGYFHDYFSAPVSYEKKAAMLKRTLDRISKYSSDFILLPLGADHLAAASDIKNQIEEVSKYLDDYEIILSTPFEYLEKVNNNYNKNINTEFRDTKRNFILPGVYSSRIDLKQQNSIYQWQISRFIQPLQAFCSFLDKKNNYQNEIDYIYKLLIKNHPHDSIYGCSVDNVHKENKMRFKKVSEASNAVLNSIRRNLYSNNSLSVVNLSNFTFSGALKIKTDKKLDKFYNAQLLSTQKGFPLCKVYDINQIPITEDYTKLYEYLVDLKDIKPFSIQKIDNNNLNKNSELKISNNHIENAKISLEVQNGVLCLKDKLKNKIYKNFINFIDRADIGDSYNFGALKNDKPINSKLLRSKIKQEGHIQSILELTFEIFIPEFSNDTGRSKKVKKHILKLDVVLQNQNDFIEFNLNWNNKSKDHILQVEFNLDNPVTETVSDDLAGYVKRTFDADYDIYSLIPAPRGIELKHNTAPFQKLLFTQNVGFITEGLQEYEVFKNKLRLTLLRSTGTISNPHNPTRGTPAGPPLPTPDLQLIGDNSARFAIGFKNDIKDFESDVEKFYQSSILLEADLQSFDDCISSGNSNILLSTAKLSQNGDLIIRFLNKSDIKQKIEFKTSIKNNGIYYTDAMENQTNKYEDSFIDANSFVTLLIKIN